MLLNCRCLLLVARLHFDDSVETLQSWKTISNLSNWLSHRLNFVEIQSKLFDKLWLSPQLVESVGSARQRSGRWATARSDQERTRRERGTNMEHRRHRRHGRHGRHFDSVNSIRYSIVSNIMSEFNDIQRHSTTLTAIEHLKKPIPAKGWKHSYQPSELYLTEHWLHWSWSCKKFRNLRR